MEKSFLRQLREAVSALTIALIATFVPCALFGMMGTVLAMWVWDHDTAAIIISWGIFAGTMFIYALVDRVALRIYDQLTTYTYRTGHNHFSFWDLIDIAGYGWFSTDRRPPRPPRARAYYYDS